MKTYFEDKVKDTIKKYKLLNKNDRILVACSGGKDSTTVLYLLKKQGYNIEALFINLFIGKYTEKNRNNVKKFCSSLGIKLYEVSVKDITGYSICYLKSILNSKGFNLKSCAICGSIKRYILNKYAKKLNKTKLVTGHNLDDEAQSFMMNLLKGRIDTSIRLGPKTGVIEDKHFIPRVKPLYFCYEKEIKDYSKLMKFPVVYERCPCSIDAFRRNIGKLLDELEKDTPDIKIKVVNYFLKTLSKLKKGYKNLDYCKKCGEPSSNDICNVCNIINLLKQNLSNNKS